MEQGIFISVAESENHIEDFGRFMNDTTSTLQAKEKGYYHDKGGEKLENEVLSCMKAKAADYQFDPNLIFHTKPQHFPDLVSNEYFGVEVKTANGKWTSTGSSIVESLREESIKKVYMLFGNLSKDKADFMCRPYEDVLYDIAVTHSPRYLINMQLKKGETIFDKKKINIPYDEFRSLGESQIEKVREYYRKEYKRKNAKTLPWWIGNDPESVDYNLKLLSDIDNRDFYIARCYALFPEILGKDSDKFRRPVLWLCSRYSIVCSNIRDQFTAGGTGNIWINDTLRWTKVPKVICNMLAYIGEIKDLYSIKQSELLFDYQDFSIYTDSLDMNFDEWKKKANKYIAETTDSSLDLTIDKILPYKFLHKKNIDQKDNYYLTEL